MILMILMAFVWIFLALTALAAFTIRWLRWLGIVQQKEYRLDRLTSFLHTEAGTRDLVRIWPVPSDFTRTGLKRPATTLRITLIANESFVLIGLPLLLSWWLTHSIWALGLVAIVLHLLMPFLLMLACVPTAVFARAMTEQMLHRAQQKLQHANVKIIGIGGSYGKTSTKHLLAHVLGQKFRVFVTPRSHNTRYSVAKSIVDGYTDQEIAILEYGAYTVGEIAELTKWFPPKLAVETGFTAQHLSLFGSIENSQAAEAELVAALPLGEKVFCNAEDPGAVKICEIGAAMNRAEMVPYTGGKSEVLLDQVQINERGELSFCWHLVCVNSKLIGRHYVPNVQAAIAVARSFGMTKDEIMQALETFVPNDSFVQSHMLSGGAVCIDDGATSNPKGFSAAIALAKELPESNKILITAGIVDLGKEATQVHSQLAAEAKAVFGQVLYVGVDGQSQFQELFGEKVVTDRSQIETILKSAQYGTVILVEGWVPAWVNSLLPVK